MRDGLLDWLAYRHCTAWRSSTKVAFFASSSELEDYVIASVWYITLTWLLNIPLRNGIKNEKRPEKFLLGPQNSWHAIGFAEGSFHVAAVILMTARAFTHGRSRSCWGTFSNPILLLEQETSQPGVCRSLPRSLFSELSNRTKLHGAYCCWEDRLNRGRERERDD